MPVTKFDASSGLAAFFAAFGGREAEPIRGRRHPSLRLPGREREQDYYVWIRVRARVRAAKPVRGPGNLAASHRLDRCARCLASLSNLSGRLKAAPE